ncbi:methyltransferase domain-containing protein [Sulfitobacter sp. LCG007]
MKHGFLQKAYEARSADETRALYDEWSATYEEEIRDQGYATPGRCAAALAKFAPDQTLPILDFGCGTGLSGLSLKLAGFATIDGVDISPDMLAKAEAKRLYRDLRIVEPGENLAPICRNYSAVAAIGVIGAGSAPPTVIDGILSGLPREGLFVMSFNDHALADKANTGRLNEWLDCGAARCLFREHGPHLPGIGLNSTVYVIQKN